jgi:Aromatic-ring-opening dioxygenase LigAB, LigA subunit
MSLYQLNKILYLLEVDAEFLTKIKSNPAEATKSMELTDEERSALLRGDVGKLYLLGANPFILDSIARHELFGLNRESYLAAVRAAAASRSGTTTPGS